MRNHFKLMTAVTLLSVALPTWVWSKQESPIHSPSPLPSEQPLISAPPVPQAQSLATPSPESSASSTSSPQRASLPLNSPSPQSSEHGLSFKSERVSVADSKKSKFQIRDGLVIGGDRVINQVVIKNIRFSRQTGFERVVIDLEGTRNGETTAIQRPPYYQVDINPSQKRIGVSIWGKPELRFDVGKVNQVFKKSSVFRGISLLPKLEDEVWTFVLPMKSNATVEVFELSQPVRIIMDITHKKS